MRGREIKRLARGPVERKTYTTDRVYAAIVDFHDQTGRAPSYRELREVIGCSLSTLHIIVKQLESEERVIPNPGGRAGFIVPRRK